MKIETKGIEVEKSLLKLAETPDSEINYAHLFNLLGKRKRFAKLYKEAKREGVIMEDSYLESFSYLNEQIIKLMGLETL